MQSDCGDFRFTDSKGNALPYYIVSGCRSSNNFIHIYFDTFPSGEQTVYFYYGNPTARNGFEDSDFSTEASDYTIGTVGSQEVGPGPVGYWSFDEGFGTTTHDMTDQGNDGTISGATWQDESMCVSGKCLYFDGTDQTMVDVDVEDNLQEYTVCSWFKISSLNNTDGDSIQMIASKGFEFRVRDTGELNFRVSTSDSWPEVKSRENLDINKWYYACAIHNGMGSYPDLYVNGSNKGEDASSGTGTQSDDSGKILRIGTHTDNEWGSNFYGYIDEVKIYPYARSADEIRQDYAAGQAGVSAAKGVSASFGGSSDNWMSDGLVGYWKFDESATTSGAVDSSGNGNDGTYYGNASTSAGKFGNGYESDGNTDWVEISDSSELNTYGSDFTVSAWINLDNYNSSNSSVIFGRFTEGAGMELKIIGEGGTYPHKIALKTWSSDDQNLFGEQDVPLGSWHHVTAVYDISKQTGTLYLDGEIDASAALSPHDNLASHNAHIGIDSRDETGYDIDGQIDEVRVYNRALSQDEVKKLYEWAPRPIGYWKLDEGAGTTVNDSSGNGRAGTISNGAWAGGKYGSGVRLGGSDSYIEFPDF
jgi:hypothetical protein